MHLPSHLTDKSVPFESCPEPWTIHGLLVGEVVVEGDSSRFANIALYWEPLNPKLVTIGKLAVQLRCAGGPQIIAAIYIHIRASGRMARRLYEIAQHGNAAVTAIGTPFISESGVGWGLDVVAIEAKFDGPAGVK